MCRPSILRGQAQVQVGTGPGRGQLHRPSLGATVGAYINARSQATLGVEGALFQGAGNPVGVGSRAMQPALQRFQRGPRWA